MALTFAQIRDVVNKAFRDHVLQGVPASGANDPVKREIRDALHQIIIAIEAGGFVAPPDWTADLADVQSKLEDIDVVRNGLGTVSAKALEARASALEAENARNDAVAIYGSIEAVRSAADVSQDALQQIEDIASGAPEAPSILTKANRNGSNVEADAFRGAIGAAPITARASLIAPLTTAGIKAMGQSLDDDRLRSGYIPTFNGDVTLTETIVIREPGVRIFGDGGATYNRGAGKKGWLLGATGIGRMFDLGASRPSGAGENPADQWEIDHISLKQAPGVPIRSVDGIGFTARNNGPDRGAHIRSCSFIGLKDAITVENLDVSVTLASLNIESCVFQACDSAVNAKGRIFGMRFVANQCEQNFGLSGGVIRLRTHSQKSTVAARAMADRKTFGHRS